MKFRNGFWRLHDGVTAHYAAEAYEARAVEDTLRILAPVQPIRHRGDMLKGPVITVEATAPMPDVIAVRFTHFAGSVRHAETLPLPGRDRDESAKIELTDDMASITSGGLTLRVDRGEWGLEFVAGGRVLTRSGSRQMAIVDDERGPDPRHYMMEQLDLGFDERIYGLGERFGAFVKNGQVVDIWNEDGGTQSEQAYKNVPFYLSDAGYGVFVNHTGPVSFEVGSETTSRVQFSVEDHSLEYMVIHGPSPKEILERYTELTGRPALPPQWSLGLWLSTSFTTDYDEATVTGFVDGMAERDLPLDVFHFDCFWMRGYRWCDFEWDPDLFEDPEAMLARLKARGLRICVWINPYIAQESRLFAEGVERGYLLRRPDGSPWQWDLWQPGMGLVDFTNPDARRWYTNELGRLLDMGVDCFKTDFGERVPTDVAYHDGSDPELMHNYYAHLYNKTVFDLLVERRGEGEAVLFARSAAAGGQQYPVHWGGDCESTFSAMAESLRGGLSLGLSGFGFWSHDIGGFEGTPDPDVFKRWLAFGLLSSHSRLHGSKSYRVPWLVDDESVDVLRHFADLKLRLMPYLWDASVTAHETGVPVMRAMVLEFGDDPACAYLDRQYLLGERLLVAPVLSHDGEVSYYVPEGRWTHLLSGAVVEGPSWHRETHDPFSLPLLVRPSTLLATTAEAGSSADRDLTEGLVLTIYELADGAEAGATVHAADGSVAATFTARRDGSTIVVERTGSCGDWRVEIAGATGVAVDVPAGVGRAQLAV
ncbi:MAG: alpha-xylosidase [Actinomycetota bacterium]|nr:alpha-xylosidase [Actinomycetota bacterium]